MILSPVTKVYERQWIGSEKVGEIVRDILPWAEAAIYTIAIGLLGELVDRTGRGVCPFQLWRPASAEATYAQPSEWTDQVPAMQVNVWCDVHARTGVETSFRITTARFGLATFSEQPLTTSSSRTTPPGTRITRLVCNTTAIAKAWLYRRSTSRRLTSCASASIS